MSNIIGYFGKNTMALQPQVAIGEPVKIGNEGPPPKKQKQKQAADRISVDVSGTKFVVERSTLTENSTFFESLLSDEWDEDNSKKEVFIDGEDPAVFRTLLSFMYRGWINIGEVDMAVLHAAEFLGVEKLLLAAKVRWYCAIGKGPVLSDEVEIAAAFDSEYGGIGNAHSDGRFKCFVDNHSDHAEKHVVSLEYDYPSRHPDFEYEVAIREIDDSGHGHCYMGKLLYLGLGESIISALNGLYAMGYTLDQDQDDDICLVLSRKKHFAGHSCVTDVLRSSDQGALLYIKQFALHVRKMEDWEVSFAPDDSSQVIWSQVQVTTADLGLMVGSTGLKGRGFQTRDKWIEDLPYIKGYINEIAEHHAAEHVAQHNGPHPNDQPVPTLLADVVSSIESRVYTREVEVKMSDFQRTWAWDTA